MDNLTVGEFLKKVNKVFAMKTSFFSVRLSDGLDEIITKMIKYTLVKVIPVLDEEDRVVSSLDILDIIEYKIRGEGM